MIYLLKRKGSVDWDEYHGFVVRADSEEDAREAAQHWDNNSRKWWKNPKLSSCEEVKNSGQREIILSDFKAG